MRAAPALVWPRLWRSLGWCLIALVVYLSLGPPPPTGGLSHADKLGHTLAYFALMGWWTQLAPRPPRLAVLFLLMGGTLELAQHWGGQRSGEFLDLAANALGIALGWLNTRLLPDWLARLEQMLRR